MLTNRQKSALARALYYDIETAERGVPRDWVTFLGCRFEDIDEVIEIAENLGFHFIDAELFRHKNVSTEEFCQLIEFYNHNKFIMLLPREIPFSICFFLYQLADHGIVSTEGSYSSDQKYIDMAGNSLAIISTIGDWEEIEFETGWDRSKLDRVCSNYCWLHDNRYG